MILSDKKILTLLSNNKLSITPFVIGSARGTLSYGLSSYGYDVTLAPELEIFENQHEGDCIYPKNFNPSVLRRTTQDFMLPPHSFALAQTMEYIRMPENVMGIILGKSTYARCGLILNTTPLEPGWEGRITLELSNTTPFHLRVYPHEGIGQLLLFEGDDFPMHTYATRSGKYQNQTKITYPKV